MPSVYYKCDLCGMTANSEIEAVKCEESHLTALNIKGLKYRNSKPYPYEIEVIFSDNSKRKYVSEELSKYKFND